MSLCFPEQEIKLGVHETCRRLITMITLIAYLAALVAVTLTPAAALANKFIGKG
jgi:hypothetical protein